MIYYLSELSSIFLFIKAKDKQTSRYTTKFLRLCQELGCTYFTSNIPNLIYDIQSIRNTHQFLAKTVFKALIPKCIKQNTSLFPLAQKIVLETGCTNFTSNTAALICGIKK